MSPETVALVFPGQGSQFVGMGREIETFPEAQQVFAQADEVLGMSLSRLMFEGPESDLNETLNTQPALLTHCVASLRVLESHMNVRVMDRVRFVAGHSLGEFAAWVCAGALSFPDALRLVRERGRLMKAAGDSQPGGMAAVLALSREAVEEVCAQASAETGKPVQVANDNCPGQSVMSGDKAALARAIELAKARGAKRCVALAVSIGAHSPLMAASADEFRIALQAVPWGEARIPVVANATALPAGPDQAVELLSAQLTSPVRWTESIQYMAGQGVTHFIEVGPKDVLGGLIRRIDKTVTALSMGKPTDLPALESL